ncbi:MAG: hypothetical protein ABSF69_09000 [Polyangiaceae bacterium]
MPERTRDRFVTGGLILYTLAAATALLLSGARLVSCDASTPWAALGAGSASLTYDDGFYYLRIAEHVARGAGSTFDGIHATNGYHPLWLLCLVPIFRLASSSHVALLLAVLLQGALMAACAGLTYQIARFDFQRFGAILAALLWVHAQLPYRAALSGTEYSLHAVCVLTVIYSCRRWFARDPPGMRAYLALGMLLGLTFLARLDSVLLFGCIALWLGWREVRGGLTSTGAGRLLALTSPVAGTVVLYAVANARLFGHPLPVNGVIKREWSAQLLQHDPVYQAHGWLVAKLWNVLWPFGHMKHAYVLFLALGSAAVAVAWLLAVLAGARLTWFERASPLWGSLVLASVLQISVYSVAYHDGYSFQRWYFVVQPWLGALLLAAIVEATCVRAGQFALSLHRVWHLGPALSLAVLFGVVLASARTIGQWRKEAALGVSREPLYAAARWVEANVPYTAIVGAWNAGIISYLSGRCVVNLDGLVNSWEFYQTKRKNMCQYWRETGIRYVVDTFEINHEFEFSDDSPAPGADLSSCAPNIHRVWTGPAYPDTSQHAEAFEVRFAR